MSESLRHAVVTLAAILTKQQQRLCVAESCTGGGLSYWLTSIQGSSTWFDRGFVTYSNRSKMEMLGVNSDIINTHGAVSEETACAMAEGALSHSEADYAIAITGIAGPDGGSPLKPVGTVWIGLARKSTKTISHRHVFTGDRIAIRKAAMLASLEALATLLLHDPS